MAARGVVAFELIIYLGRCIQSLFQKVSPYQRRWPVHPVEILNLTGNLEETGVVVQLLAA